MPRPSGCPNPRACWACPWAGPNHVTAQSRLFYFSVSDAVIWFSSCVTVWFLYSSGIKKICTRQRRKEFEWFKHGEERLHGREGEEGRGEWRDSTEEGASGELDWRRGEEGSGLAWRVKGLSSRLQISKHTNQRCSFHSTQRSMVVVGISAASIKLPLVPRKRPHLPFSSSFALPLTQPSRFSMAFSSSSSSSPLPHAKTSNDSSVKVPSSSLIGQNDLLIVGPGVLGRIIADMWKQEFPGCKIYGQTMSTDHHNELAEIGILPSLKGSLISDKVPYVIFCAPPSRSEDYTADVRVVTSNWNGGGSFLFTSSSAPYDRNDNGPCDEDSPVVPLGRSPRTDILLNAEKVVLEAGGCVVRLAGLYISFKSYQLFFFLNWIVCTKKIEGLIHTGCQKVQLMHALIMCSILYIMRMLLLSL
ncbi:hypothetical protein LUZ60_011504 [Juncus effusus]|nr:hypothetical protein LUZ60_011504 [Juncus effusus]